ncbi:MAG TPA: response regulator [Polyangiaceae bacterium]|jgi:CheY-like chemotaxis protein
MMKPGAAVLLVEDNAFSQLAMRVLLDRLGCSCEIAGGGREAIALFRSAPHALVLMDLMMAGMDGFHAARALRAVEFGTGRRTPIVAVTALDEDLVRGDCLSAGMDDVLPKPVDFESLAAKLALWMHLRAPGAVTAPAPVATPGPADEVAHELPSQDVLRATYGPENIHRIVTTFLSVTGTLLAELETAISAQDGALVRTTLHELKGATLQVRAREMARLCFELEDAKPQERSHGDGVDLRGAGSRIPPGERARRRRHRGRMTGRLTAPRRRAARRARRRSSPGRWRRRRRATDR